MRVRSWSFVLVLACLVLGGAAQSLVRETVVAKEINFALNKSQLDVSARRVLDEVAATLAANDTMPATLIGHTCDLASSPYNERLARRRVDAARQYLIRKGIAGDRLEIGSRGEEQPKYDNSNPAQQALNRRVEIRMVFRREIPAPEVRLSADPISIVRGQSTRLTWSSAHATSVSVAPAPGSVDLEGTSSVSPSTSTTFIATARGEGGEATAATAVQVTAPRPTVTLSANPPSIVKGHSATLNWSSENAASVTVTPGVGEVGTNGSAPVTPDENTTFTAVARGEGGEATASAAVQVTAPRPTVVLSVEPATIVRGQTATLRWTSENASMVTVLPGVGEAGASGSAPIAPTANATYTATARGAGGEATATAAVLVTSPRPTVSLTATPATIDPGRSSILVWTSEHASSVEIAPAVGSVALNGNAAVLPADNTAYTAIARGEGGEATATAVVVVTAPPPRQTLRTTFATVVDEAGNFVKDLPAERFRVDEGGEEREIVAVTYENLGATAGIALVLDRSASISGDIGELRDAAVAFIEEKKPEDRILTLAFSSDVAVLRDFDADKGSIASAIRGMSAYGTTRLYDALFMASERLRAEAEPRIVVLMTDGVDEGGFGSRGSEHSFEQALGAAKAANIAVYAVGLGEKLDRTLLERIAAETGGHAYFTVDPSRLREIYRNLSLGLLRGRYRIIYRTMENVDGEVTVSCQGGKVVGRNQSER